MSRVKDLLEKILQGQILTALEAEELMSLILTGQALPAQIAAVLAALRLRGERPEEVAALARAMLRFARPVKHNLPLVIDTCGTGGDGAGTFNLSTAAALVAAALGIPVAKHGNRSVSSRCGSSDLVEELGLPLPNQPERAARILEEQGFVFLFAPFYHPALATVMPVRKEMGVRTVFNLLGPLCNPAHPQAQVIGVFATSWVKPFAEVMVELGRKRGVVVHGADGLDEFSPTGENLLALVQDGQITIKSVMPEEIGIAGCQLQDLKGGDQRQNARMLLDLFFRPQAGPLLEATVANAALALWVAGTISDLREGVRIAREAILQGRVANYLAEIGVREVAM
ncbi:anthranilate phosphoribosyltransferase [Carboxydocella sporoproducens DSM 16521]|uniref:Anthranilate phosphoribosyltransferase n=2 Tax=Carboxydocella TaxID=178898 RepID=A0A1T4RTT3_9FIRM|nr:MULTISPECIES: anthranilate phosphoribosyltransferase [Carboxydocella]AVX20390.1 anthranilate phosphoribosyltransferase [Carboxydocella thermautotrophica]SKA19390.1 anthranilate phosphoribosyltransferase [Carboxydocella sporoproducens DSM 16521]